MGTLKTCAKISQALFKINPNIDEKALKTVFFKYIIYAVGNTRIIGTENEPEKLKATCK